MAERGKILVVDDDQDVRETLRDYFEHSGFDVFVAGDGAGMRKVLAARAVDLVLMDLGLPGEDGFTLTRELRCCDMPQRRPASLNEACWATRLAHRSWASVKTTDSLIL